MSNTLNDEQKRELGVMIQDYRHRMVQINNGKPWTQEDLAVAIGSDKAHVNRLEKGKQLPTEQTLEKICTALELSWEEKRWLITKAGYYAMPPAPEEEEINHAIGLIDSHIVKYPHPAILLDQEAMIWDINDLEAYTFYGYENRDEFLGDCRGLRIIELLMTPLFSNWFEKIIENYDQYLRRQIMRFMMLYMRFQNNEEYQNIKKRIMEIDEMRRVWQDITEHSIGDNDLLFVDHQILKVNHPDIGHYEVQVWHSEMAFDERFSLIQHIPNDVETMQLFMDMQKK